MVIVKRGWNRFKKDIKAIYKGNLIFVGVKPFIIMEKHVEFTPSSDGEGSVSFYLSVMSRDGNYKNEIKIHPSDYKKYKRKINMLEETFYHFGVIQHRKTKEYYVTLEKNDVKAKNYLFKQALISLLTLFIVLCLISFTITFIIIKFT